MQEIDKYLTPNDKKKRLKYMQQAKEYYDQVLSDPYIRSFIKEHELTKKEIHQSRSTFAQWYSSKHMINGIFKGYIPILTYASHRVILSYKASKELQKQRKDKMRRDNVVLFNESITLKDASNKDLYKDDARNEIIKYIHDVYKRYKADPHCLWGGNHGMKGCYLHGDFGVGKTYIMAILANNLASLGAKVVFLHMPTFITTLSDYINSKHKNVNDLVRKASNADVLIVDDIGAENISEWARDNIFSVIMQHRMDNCQLTCFTSNLSMLDLAIHFTQTRTDISPVKSRRLMERIMFLADTIQLVDEDKNGENNDWRLKKFDEDDNLNDMD